jgi:hypothetical protein
MPEAPLPIKEGSKPATLEMERRFSERYRCCRQPPVRLLAKPSFQPVHARVHDITTRSMGLILDRPFDVGTVLAIQLQTKHAGFSGILSGRVQHSTQQADGTWRVGCTLSRSLTDDEFFALL